MSVGAGTLYPDPGCLPIHRMSTAAILLLYPCRRRGRFLPARYGVFGSRGFFAKTKSNVDKERPSTVTVPLVGRIDTIDYLEECRFASAIWSDEAKTVASLELKVDSTKPTFPKYRDVFAPPTAGNMLYFNMLCGL